MKARNIIITLSTLCASTVASILIINKVIKSRAVSDHVLDDPDAFIYRSRLGDVSYKKYGNGRPLLLIHSLTAVSSGYEWYRLIPYLRDDYTVYVIDLPGCGMSEKANLTYTNPMFVQLISGFIRSEIGRRTSVLTSGESASIPLMICCNQPELIDQMVLINPLSLLVYKSLPGKSAKLYKFVMDQPIIGTLIYHLAVRESSIINKYISEQFFNGDTVTTADIRALYESAHLGRCPKAFYASVKCSYTKCGINAALKKINNSIYLIGGRETEKIEERLQEYVDLNSSVEYTLVPKSKGLPHMERPMLTAEIIKTYIQ